MRLATWHADLSRKGPGLLLRDLLGGKDAGLIAGIALMAQTHPDVLLLTDMDFDHDGVALARAQALLAKAGHDLPYIFVARPNTGIATGRDLDGDGRKGGPRDAQGFGWFSGQGGQAVLSRWPVRLLADHSAVLWRDVPDSSIAPDDPGWDIQRLSTSAHWVLQIDRPGAPLTLLTLAATPPLFDGPKDRNGRRNHDEVLYWLQLLDGRLDTGPPEGAFAIMGNFNLDPDTGDGLRSAVQEVLAHPALQDVMPGQPSVTWDGPGKMRVSYILPARDLKVTGTGTATAVPGLGPHRLIWADLDLPPSPKPPQGPSG